MRFEGYRLGIKGIEIGHTFLEEIGFSGCKSATVASTISISTGLLCVGTKNV